MTSKFTWGLKIHIWFPPPTDIIFFWGSWSKFWSRSWCFLRLGLSLHSLLVLHESDARISSNRHGEQESLNGCYWVLVYV